MTLKTKFVIDLPDPLIKHRKLKPYTSTVYSAKVSLTRRLKIPNIKLHLLSGALFIKLSIRCKNVFANS